MDARLDYSSSEILQKFVKHLNAAAATVPQGTLPLATVNLVLTRVSQINGCAVCVDMHTQDADHPPDDYPGQHPRVVCGPGHRQTGQLSLR